MQRSGRTVAWIVATAVLLAVLWIAWKVLRLAAVVMFWSAAVIVVAAVGAYLVFRTQRSG